MQLFVKIVKNKLINQRLDIMKTIEQFVTDKYLGELQFPNHKRTREDYYIDWAQFGAREAQRFIPFEEEMPPEHEEVLFYNEKWINEDFNPRGIRIGFMSNDDFTTAHWWSYQDTYETISHSDCDGNESFSQEIRESINPTHWRPLFREL